LLGCGRDNFYDANSAHTQLFKCADPQK
jgi:hypothetical protein